MKRLIEQVLSWDIRSPSQRNRPHKSLLTSENSETSVNIEDCEGEEAFDPVIEAGPSDLIVYHLILEGLDVSYKIDCEGNVLVDCVTFAISTQKTNQNRCNYSMWRDKLGI